MAEKLIDYAAGFQRRDNEPVLRHEPAGAAYVGVYPPGLSKLVVAKRNGIALRSDPSVHGTEHQENPHLSGDPWRLSRV